MKLHIGGTYGRPVTIEYDGEEVPQHVEVDGVIWRCTASCLKPREGWYRQAINVVKLGQR